MRHRESVILNETVSASVFDERSNSTSNSSAVNFGLKTIDDCLTASYHKVRSSGGVLPVLPVKIETTISTFQPQSFDLKRDSDNKRQYGTQFVSSPLSFPSLPAVDNAAIAYVVNAASADAKNEALDALTTLAELNKTSLMVKNRFEGILRYANRSYQRALKPRWSPEKFAEYWLEYRYGWRPLVYDVQNVVSQLSEGRRSYNRGRSSTSVDLSFSASSTQVTSDRNLVWAANRTGTRTYRGFALAIGEFGAMPTFNPVQTVWELTPFSFVVDWMIDIGSYLSAITPIPGVDIRASGYSIQDSFSDRTTWLSVTNPGSGHTVTSSSTGVIERSVEQYSRSPSGVLLPGLFPRLNNLRAVDLVALVFQRLRPLSRLLNLPR